METVDALMACLPPVSYDRHGVRVRQEMATVAAALDEAAVSAETLRAEHQPSTAALALGDWERNYNLPDACVGGSGATLEARRASLVERILGRGDLSIGSYLAIAESLGYPGCTITEFGMMTCQDACDTSVADDGFIGYWRLNVPAATAIVVASCASPSDAALRAWGNTQLECMIKRRKPAHTVALFGYAI